MPLARWLGHCDGKFEMALSRSNISQYQEHSAKNQVSLQKRYRVALKFSRGQGLLTSGT